MPAVRDERGDSLVEILAALAILSVGVIGLLTALATQVSTTTTNRSQTHVTTTLLAVAEYVKALPFTACGPGAATSVTTAQVPHDPAFTATYGPGAPVGSTPCSALTSVPVTVSGDGFSVTVSVVKRP